MDPAGYHMIINTAVGCGLPAPASTWERLCPNPGHVQTLSQHTPTLPDAPCTHCMSNLQAALPYFGDALQVRWLQDAAYVHVVVDGLSGGLSQNSSWAVSFPRQRGGFTTAQCRGPPGACALASAPPCVMGSGSLHRFICKTSTPPTAATLLGARLVHQLHTYHSAWVILRPAVGE